jgi:hypothetical protein
MSIYSKSSTAIKEKRKEQSLDEEKTESYLAEIIPWPDIHKIRKRAKAKEKKRTYLEGKYLYYRERKIPILQFQKSGYDKLLKYLVKEIER